MTQAEFDQLWQQLTALWAGWARKIGKGGALTHVQRQWWIMLLAAPLSAAEEAVSAHWQEAGAKYSPDPAAIAARCGTASGRAWTPAERDAAAAFYAADRIEQHRLLADAASRRAVLAMTDWEREAAITTLRTLAGYAARMAEAQARTVERLAADPRTPPEQMEYSRRLAERAAEVARRVATLARVRPPAGKGGGR